MSESALGLNLAEEFNQVYLSGIERTKLDKIRIEMFLPKSLRQAFKDAKGRRVLEDTPLHRELITYLKHDVFGKLRDYDAPITPEDARGFEINGQLRMIYMNRVIGRSQLQRELLGLDEAKVIDAAHQTIRARYSRNDITVVVVAGGGSRLDRQLAGHIVTTARQMKQEPI